MSFPLKRRLSVVAAPALAAAIVPFAGASGASAAPSTGATRHIQKVGTGVVVPAPVGSGLPAPISTEIPRAFGPEAAGSGAAATNRPAPPDRSLSRRNGTATGRGAAVPASVIRTGPQLLTSFDGINHRDQRTADNGNQFSLEPPDQALCVGNGYVVEAVNDAVRVRRPDGSSPTGVVALNPFLGYPSEIVRSTPPVYGPVVTDPSCLFDPTTHAFFLTVLTLEVDPATGDFTGRNHLDVAVAHDPTGSWTIYRLDVTDDGLGGTPVHANCPCLGDYPHIGVDAHGFYLTTNEYSFFGTEFNGAQIYTFSKRALARGDADVLVTQFDTTGADRGLNGFTVWPAQSPSDRQYSRAAGGTEFFLSSNAAEEATGQPTGSSTSIVTWSLTNTNSLDSASPDPRLHNTRVPVDRYSLPPLSNQKPGPVPLADCLNDPTCAPLVLGAPDPYVPEQEHGLDSNDTRMQQVVYANGLLYGALDTAVTVGGATKAGISWYIVAPFSHPASVDAHLVNQGKLGLARNNLTYPAVGLTDAGKGVIAFTLVGDGYYPSSAFAAFDGLRGAGSIYLAKAGVGPDDGFSGYKAFNNPPRPRWGDYGATAVDGPYLWIASEYIGQSCTLAEYRAAPFGSCGGTRTALANWDTRISKIRP